MKIFITGGSGYLGHSLTLKLAEEGNQIHLLLRDPGSVIAPRHPRITPFRGDINDRDLVAVAMAGCSQVYHTAAAVRLWVKDPDEMFSTNVQGTANVLEAARNEGVSRIVYTSTCGVIGPCIREPMTENDPRISGFSIDYELSKKMAEDLVLQYARDGLDALVVSPPKIYGPGKVSQKHNANAAIDRFLKSRVAFIPSPGSYQTCFAFIDDVVDGHLLAMEKGRAGEKYILGGVNISYYAFFDLIRKISGNRGVIIQLPKNSVRGWAILQRLNYFIGGKDPLFTAEAVDRFFSNYCFSSEKAVGELGYRITPLEEALGKTIHFLNQPVYA
jgi:nucleoside-diphosphate-sugar epimerase